jgi:signal peptidase II
MLARGILIAIIVAIIDQLAKWRIVDYFAVHPEVERHVTVTGFFNLVLTMNRGISFGMFNNDPHIGEVILVGLAAVIVIGLLIWLRRLAAGLPAVAIGMIIGGAAGNAVDRVVRGAVVDFLDFHAGQWHPFAFNLADAAISVGVGLLILDGLLGGGAGRSRSGAKGAMV